MNGPELLEPPVERSRMLPTALGTREAEYNGGIIGYDDEGLIADFTEDRCNRQLAQIARRLLLPDSYVEACFDLHQFLALHTTLVEAEAVQRNVFKCLKICARLSKLPGYSIQLMWQVIQQAHQLIDLFTAERACTINLWLTKLTNRIRLMAVTPASDGSAPPRLPIVPPPELLHAHTREKLLPLPAISVTALNDGAFNRVAGVSSASHYLANPLRSASQPESASAMALPLPASAELDAGADIEVPSAEPAVEEVPDSVSTREAELAIIELQLRELEGIPAHRMGPMLRAALNLLVEMRFRLQLGLPRQAIAADGLEAAAASQGEQPNEEMRIVDHVLDQISTSRRLQAQARAAAGGSSSFGLPLFMVSPPLSHLSGDYSLTDVSDYSDSRSRRRVARLRAPPGNDARRRRSESGSESLDDQEGEEEEASTAAGGESDDQQRRRRNRLRRRIFEI
ncbi:hypothetical protein GGI20_002910 [Coemansia sp. BCRC 34301]|nr:hypothetical protein GGI20_002910 [Coemansia sp. BCRC 34301]